MKSSARSFLAIFSLIYGSLHGYIWWRLVYPLEVNGPIQVLFMFIFICLFVSFPISHFALRKVTHPMITLLNFISSVWMGIVVYLVLVCLCFEFLKLIFFRETDFGLSVTITIVTIVCLITIYGLIEAKWIGITNLNIRISKLSPKLAGFRIVQISDVHLGIILRDNFLRKVVQKVNQLEPDLIVITGDFVDEQAFYIKDILAQIQEFQSKHGTYAITGNHEFYAGVERAQRFIESAGITMLRNRWVTIADEIQLIGRDDPAGNLGDTPSLADITKNIDRTKPTVLLYHTPGTSFEELETSGIDLQLSGHTHRGQLWPFNYIVKRIFNTPYGRFNSRDTTIYVSRGTGTWGPPMRVGARPEITLLTLSCTS